MGMDTHTQRITHKFDIHFVLIDQRFKYVSERRQQNVVRGGKKGGSGEKCSLSLKGFPMKSTLIAELKIPSVSLEAGLRQCLSIGFPRTTTMKSRPQTRLRRPKPAGLNFKVQHTFTLVEMHLP